ncbi:MAG: hypothetical protein FWG80_02100 [Alphaproteobacteria bacterium]|nr:hypothetical protein [Alphaproteobacteria bacterium]
MAKGSIGTYSHNVLTVNVNQSKNIVDTAWKVNKDVDFSKVELVLGEHEGIIIYVYKPEKWFKEINADKTEKPQPRYRFEGKMVSHEYPDYLGKKITKKQGEQWPARFRKKGDSF